MAALAITSYIEDTPISAFVVRSKAKEYGTRKLIEGTLTKGSSVAIVDDTCSTGGNLLHAIEAVEAEGCSVVKVLVILDREQGGSDTLKSHGYKFTSLMKVDNDGSVRVQENFLGVNKSQTGLNVQLFDSTRVSVYESLARLHLTTH